MTTIIVDETIVDSATQALTLAARRRGPAQVIFLEQFLVDNGWFFDRDRGYLVVDRHLETLHKDERIINRVVRISSQTCAKLDGNEGILTANMAFAAYASVLDRHDDVFGVPGLYSPVGMLLPLNLQWKTMAPQLVEASTPRFRYAFGSDGADVGDFREPLWKSPFDLFTWQQKDASVIPELHQFVVDKPQGMPVIGYFVGDEQEIFALRDGVEISTRMKEIVLLNLSILKRVFGAFMGEALFFVNDESLVFAAFSHFMKTASSRTEFADVIERALS